MHVYRKKLPKGYCLVSEALPCDVSDHRCMMHVYRKKNSQGLLSGIRRLCLVMSMIIGV